MRSTVLLLGSLALAAGCASSPDAGQAPAASTDSGASGDTASAPLTDARTEDGAPAEGGEDTTSAADASDSDSSGDVSDTSAPVCGTGTVKGLPCDGTGLADATVRVEALSCDGAEVILETTTDSTGSFLLANVPSGSRRVYVSSPGGTRSFQAWVNPGGTTVVTAAIAHTCADAAPTLTPCPTGSLSGNVCPHGSETIAAGSTRILVESPGCPGSQAAMEFFTTATGSFELKGAPAGVRTLQVFAPGATEPWLATVVIEQNKSKDIGHIGAIGCGAFEPLPSEQPGGSGPDSPDDLLCTDPKWNLCGKDILAYCADPKPPFPDCNGDGLPDPCPQCPPIDIVFVLDTSGSMSDETDALCETITATIAKLEAAQVGATATIYGISDVWGVSCASGTVRDALGDTVADPPDGFLPIGYCDDGSEDWGPASAVVAANFPWKDGALRLVVPISDEGPACGDPLDSDDTRSIDAAVLVANEALVVVSPISGTDSGEDTMALAQSLAAGTGGKWSQSTDPSLDLASSVVLSVLEACTKVNDCNKNGLPDSCDLFSGALLDLDSDGVPDACQ